ncbi:unnamed protein product [Cuscuta campestris]|uniref:Ycf49-like protein n=1 Tax=Cuscuta campestris TaxID=132261 RepID=A0A484MFA4_9ASTE|nr:unnamed protein product [Cuscuta campestris]
MAVLPFLSSPKILPFPQSRQIQLSHAPNSPKFTFSAASHPIHGIPYGRGAMARVLEVAGIDLASVSGSASAEPPNALSLPTWAVHVSSVIEWATAMALVWQYGERSGFESWKGLSWGMVPLLGGALCACTWHFFYNSESLEVLVALQAALTLIGNATMCIAAFRIYRSSEQSSK